MEQNGQDKLTEKMIFLEMNMNITEKEVGEFLKESKLLL